MVRTIVGLALVLSGCSAPEDRNRAAGDAEEETVFSTSQRISEGREIYAAAANPAATDAEITADAKALCKVGTDWCMVVVVPDGTVLPTGFPLSDVEAPAAIGFYTLNRATGMDEFKRQTGNGEGQQ